jgi:uncharacterized protein (TIGR00162 family)
MSAFIQLFMNVEIKIARKIELGEFTLVVGLPGVAYIGKLAVDYIVQQVRAELVGEVYSKFFPPYVIIKEDGLVELLRNELHWFRDEAGKGFMFLTGNSQAMSPEGQYEISEAILDWAVEQGLKRVYSVAGYVTDQPFETPAVHGTGTSSALLEEVKRLGVQPLDHGIIGGENGLIMGLAKKKGVDGVCLLAETHGYQTELGQYLLDAKAAKSALKVLGSILNLTLDMEPLDKQAAQMDEFIAKMTEIESRVREEMSQSTKKPSYIT